jgi:hypothetical protein
MPSYTSSSDASPSGGLDRFTIILLGTVLFLLAAAEGASVVGFDRISRVQRREVSQREALLNVNDSAATEIPHIAVLGNSLLLEGVDVPLLASQLKSKFVPVPYFVLATDYYDWFFGLKRLFAEGMRPRYVVVGLSPNQFASSRTRGDYSARYLFQGSDLVEVVRRTHMDATTASGFLLSHFSKYYSTRVVTRGFVLGRVLPSVDEMLHNLAGNPHEPNVAKDLLRQLTVERLTALEQLCRTYGAGVVFVVPPTYQQGAETIAQVGRNHQHSVVVPIANDELDASYYQTDGFHLNEAGAKVFTLRLASNLREVLAK